MLSTYGYRREQVLNHPVLNLLAEEEHAEAQAFIAELNDQPANSAWTFLRGDGERVRVQVITHPLIVNGERRRLAVIWDVTEGGVRPRCAAPKPTRSCLCWPDSCKRARRN